MKKILAVLIAGMMLLTGCVVSNNTAAGEPEQETVQAQPAQTEPETAPAAEAVQTNEGPERSYEHLTVGGVTPFAGAFSTAMWGNATSDIDIRYLLHGYNLVEWNSSEGAFVVDPSVVSGIVVTEDRTSKDRTYTLSIYSDLKYSDGTPITAADYAFSLLLSVAPEVAAIGGNTANLSYLLGYEDYIRGTTPYFAGIRILSQDTIALTVRHEYLPFFYELGLLDCTPYPISVIAPGCTVRDGGNGAYIANVDQTATAPLFTSELLQKTLLDPETGYVTHPSLTSGPYKLLSYDGTTVELERNDQYKGNSAGKKPTIQKLTATTITNWEMFDDLVSGKVDVLNKVMSAEELQKGIARVAGQDDLTMTNYPRTGLSFISFCCENPQVSDEKVRQAISMCLDKDGLVTETVDIYGLRTDGYYGLGQWMYQMVDRSQEYPLQAPADNATAAEKREYEKALREWETISLSNVKVYNQDTEAAERLLVQAGWTLNREGKQFRPGQNDVRCKRVNEELQPLELKVYCPEGSSINKSLQSNLIDPLAEIGILAEMEEKPMPEL
ncbi:MAG: hypothetical protein IJS84_10750, partial [Spirochaetales bacterium]|nr:hypothetical protein [Spirochaetales bacterium]